MNAPFKSAPEAFAFLTAGRARFTLESARTGARYTYRLKGSEDGKVTFASVLYGPNNSTDYAYLGVVRGGYVLHHTPKARVASDDRRFVALRWALAQLGEGRMPSELRVWHDGACGRCGRALTVPTSLASGLGPECAGRVARPTLCVAA